MMPRGVKRTAAAAPSPLEEQVEVPDRIVSFFHDRFREVPIDLFDIVFYEYLDAHLQARRMTNVGSLVDENHRCTCTTGDDCHRVHNVEDRRRLWSVIALPNFRAEGQYFHPGHATLVKTPPRDRVRLGDTHIVSTCLSDPRALWSTHVNHEIIPPGATAGAYFLIGLNQSETYGATYARSLPQLVVMRAHPVRNDPEMRVHVSGRLTPVRLPIFRGASPHSHIWFHVRTDRTPPELGILMNSFDNQLVWTTVQFSIARGNIHDVREARQVTLMSTACHDQRRFQHRDPSGLRVRTQCQDGPCNDTVFATFHSATLLVVTHLTLHQYDWDGALLRRFSLYTPLFRNLIASDASRRLLWATIGAVTRCTTRPCLRVRGRVTVIGVDGCKTDTFTFVVAVS